MEVKLNVKMIRGWVELNTSIQTCRPQLRTCGGVAFLIEIFNTQHQDTKEKSYRHNTHGIFTGQGPIKNTELRKNKKLKKVGGKRRETNRWGSLEAGSVCSIFQSPIIRARLGSRSMGTPDCQHPLHLRNQDLKPLKPHVMGTQF